MRVIVCGAGVAGVTTAWELARKGLDVVVLDRRDMPAREASAGGGGLVAPSAALPLAGPGMPVRLLRGVGRAAPLMLRPRLAPSGWRWLARWLRNCDGARAAANARRALRLSLYARQRLDRLRGALDADPDASQGRLHLFRTARDLAAATPILALLSEAGLAHQLLDPVTALAIEPGLAASDAPLHAALFAPDDEAGDPALFAARMAARARDAGARFRWRMTVESLVAGESGAIVGVAAREASGRGEFIDADAVVLASGADAAALARPLGLDLPLMPAAGHAITLSVSNEALAPRAVLTDDASGVALSRLGDRVRVAGVVDLGGDGARAGAPQGALLLRVARDWFPKGLAIPPKADLWTGRMALTPDGPPILGPTPTPGLFLNVGHGAWGGTMALGAARLVADMVAGDAPGIDVEGLTLARYERRAVTPRTAPPPRRNSRHSAD
jgi:D-amino-acid dehydrogenase